MLIFRIFASFIEIGVNMCRLKKLISIFVSLNRNDVIIYVNAIIIVRYFLSIT